MKKSIIPFAFLLFVIGLVAPVFGQKLENSLLWEISGKGLSKPSYLYGTYHLLNDSYLAEKNPKALEVFKKADGVVVEVVLDTPAMMKAQMGMVMLDNKLSKLLDSAEYQLVKAELQQTTGMDITMFEQVKPMAIATMLSVTYTAISSPELANYTGQPLDKFFADEGARTGKKIQSFETIEEQVNILFNHFSLEDQAKQLVEMVSLKDKAFEIQRGITDNYFSQNIQAMHEESEKMVKEMPTWGSMDFITTDRNKRWMEKLPDILKSGNQFIAVSALHLPGPDGLIDLLRKQGYTVKAVL
jgi:uncharacterized protein YbaP (TraB family)